MHLPVSSDPMASANAGCHWHLASVPRLEAPRWVEQLQRRPSRRAPLICVQAPICAVQAGWIALFFCLSTAPLGTAWIGRLRTWVAAALARLEHLSGHIRPGQRIFPNRLPRWSPAMQAPENIFRADATNGPYAIAANSRDLCSLILAVGCKRYRTATAPGVATVEFGVGTDRALGAAGDFVTTADSSQKEVTARFFAPSAPAWCCPFGIPGAQCVPAQSAGKTYAVGAGSARIGPGPLK